MSDTTWKVVTFVALLVAWVIAWTFTVYWTVRLIHSAWQAGVL